MKKPQVYLSVDNNLCFNIKHPTPVYLTGRAIFYSPYYSLAAKSAHKQIKNTTLAMILKFWFITLLSLNFVVSIQSLTPVMKGVPNPKQNPSYVRFPHTLKLKPTSQPSSDEPDKSYPIFTSLIRPSWIKKFFQSEFYHKLSPPKRIIKTKISNYENLITDVGDLSKWTESIINDLDAGYYIDKFATKNGKHKNGKSTYDEKDDEDEPESHYDHEENERSNFDDWDTDPEYYSSYASKEFRLDQFIDYLVEEHGIEIDDLKGLYEADYDDIDNKVNEILYDNNKEIFIDILEPDFNNSANTPYVLFFGLMICVITYVIF